MQRRTRNNSEITNKKIVSIDNITIIISLLILFISIIFFLYSYNYLWDAIEICVPQKFDENIFIGGIN